MTMKNTMWMLIGLLGGTQEKHEYPNRIRWYFGKHRLAGVPARRGALDGAPTGRGHGAAAPRACSGTCVTGGDRVQAHGLACP